MLTAVVNFAAGSEFVARLTSHRSGICVNVLSRNGSTIRFDGIAGTALDSRAGMTEYTMVRGKTYLVTRATTSLRPYTGLSAERLIRAKLPDHLRRVLDAAKNILSRCQ